MDDTPDSSPLNESSVETSAADAEAPRSRRGRRARRLSENGSAPLEAPVEQTANGPVALPPQPPEATLDDDHLLDEEQPLSDDEPEYEDERARAFLAGGAYATIAIDRYDDLPAIFGKIDAAASPRVALVAARGNRELQRALSMRRLQRHLDLTGKDLILVTRSRALRLRAREEDLPAVGSLSRVNFHTYGRGGLHLGWLTLRLPSLGALVAVVLLVVALGAGVATLFWYLPKGEVTVFLPTTAQEETLDLTLDGQTTALNLATMTVPARRREVVVTRSIYRPATGTIQVPTSHAAVALRFTNRTNGPIVVPQGTVVVAANGVKFTVGNDIELPRFNASADVVALAQQAGTIGNVPANSVRAIEGELASRVAVNNPAPGEKGTDTPQQVVSEADVEGVRAFAEPILLDAATQELSQRLAETATIFGASASIQITDLKSTPPVGAPGKYADVRATARVSVLTVDDSDLRQIYVNQFRPRIPPDQMLLEDQFDTAVLRTGDLERATDRLPVTVQARALTAPFLDRAALQKALAGKSKPGAEKVLRGLVDSPAPPTVKISPNWAPRLPRREGRISITFAPAPR